MQEKRKIYAGKLAFSINILYLCSIKTERARTANRSLFEGITLPCPVVDAPVFDSWHWSVNCLTLQCQILLLPTFLPVSPAVSPRFSVPFSHFPSQFLPEKRYVLYWIWLTVLFVIPNLVYTFLFLFLHRLSVLWLYSCFRLHFYTLHWKKISSKFGKFRINSYLWDYRL